MKSLNLDELKRDCLNPKDENGNPLMYNGEALTFKSEAELEERIVTITSEMCQKRKYNISLVEKDYTEMKTVLPKLKNFLEKVKEKANIYKASSIKDKNLDNGTCDEILKLCDSIISTLNDYEKNIETMYTRFKNGTIRISAVGNAGQGKSTFAKYYTGLKDGRISTHKKENEETTGAVTTLINTNNNKDKDPNSEKDQYIVTYYTKKDILTTLNYYLKEIRDKLNNQQITILGVSNFEDFDRDFIQKRGSDPFQGISTDNLSILIINGLRAFYSTDIEKYGERYWYEYLDNKEAVLGTIEEQQKHILMTDKSNLYLAVKEVKMYVKFEENENIFTNFEIVDTKGAGSAAGAHADKEIYDSIDSSDAVFSIQTVNVDTKFNFYDVFLRNRYHDDKIFKTKHFIVLNPYPDNDIKKAIENLKDIGLANILYCGALYSSNCPKRKCKSEDYDENFDCILKCNVQKEEREFVKYTVRNMLLRISAMVSELDKDRIKKRVDDKKIIADKLTELVSLIGDNPYIYEGLDDVLKYIISGFIKEAKVYVDEELKKIKEPNQENNYVKYLREGKEITLYDIITNSQSDLKKANPKYSEIQTANKSNEENIVKNEIKHALELSFDNMLSELKKINFSEDECVGQYIDEFAMGLHKRLNTALVKLREQKELEPEVRKEISSVMWRLFKLDQINPSIEEGSWKYYENGSAIFELLYDTFEPKKSNDIRPEPLYEPYKILYDYFCYIPSSSSKDYQLPNLDEKESVKVNKNRLKEVATDVVFDSRIHEKIAEIYNSHSLMQQRKNLLTSLKDTLRGVNINANSCLNFYKMYSDKILTEDERNKIELAKAWTELDGVKNEINDLISKFK